MGTGVGPGHQFECLGRRQRVDDRDEVGCIGRRQDVDLATEARTGLVGEGRTVAGDGFDERVVLERPGTRHRHERAGLLVEVDSIAHEERDAFVEVGIG